MSLSRELLQHDPSIAETNGTPRSEKYIPTRFEPIPCEPDLVGQVFASFVGEMKGRASARLFMNGSPEHSITVKAERGPLGEKVNVFATGEKGPTVIAVARNIGPKKDTTHEIEELWLDGVKGEAAEEAPAALVLIADIFRENNYTLVQETIIDDKNKKYVNGVEETFDKPETFISPIDNSPTDISSGIDYTVAS